MIAPSNMMDGYVKAIREALDARWILKIFLLWLILLNLLLPTMARSVQIADSTPSAGDRKGYQMDPANSDEALREVAFGYRRRCGYRYGKTCFWRSWISYNVFMKPSIVHCAFIMSVVNMQWLRPRQQRLD